MIVYGGGRLPYTIADQREMIDVCNVIVSLLLLMVDASIREPIVFVIMCMVYARNVM